MNRIYYTNLPVNNNALDEIYLWAPRLRGPGACAPRATWLIRYWKLGAVLVIIRYNDGYKAVHNIYSSFSQSGHFTRAQEAFRLLDNKRIMASGSIEREKETTIDEETSTVKRINQMAMHEKDILLGCIPGPDQ